MNKRGRSRDDVHEADIRLGSLLTLAEWMKEFYPFLGPEKYPEDFRSLSDRYYTEQEAMYLLHEYAAFLPADEFDFYNPDNYETFEAFKSYSNSPGKEEWE